MRMRQLGMELRRLRDLAGKSQEEAAAWINKTDTTISKYETGARRIDVGNLRSLCQLYDVGPNYLVMELIEGAPLRDHAEMTSHLRLDGVIPLRKSRMSVESNGRDLFAGRLEAARILAAIEVGGDREAGLGPDGASVVENLLVGIERFACPVPRDFREQTMLDGIPLRGASGIVSHGYGQGEGVGQLPLNFFFPGVTTATVAATGIGEYEQLA